MPAPAPLAERTLFDAVLVVVGRALDRHALSAEDREDLAQDVAVAAFRRRLSYRAERGNPEQWLSGIARREIKRFLRIHHRRPWVAVGDALPDMPDGRGTPEEAVSGHDVAEHALARLLPEERRAVVLVEVDDLTFREVADREGIAASTAYARHRRGMAALRSAEGGWTLPAHAQGHLADGTEGATRARLGVTRTEAV